MNHLTYLLYGRTSSRLQRYKAKNDGILLCCTLEQVEIVIWYTDTINCLVQWGQANIGLDLYLDGWPYWYVNFVYIPSDEMLNPCLLALLLLRRQFEFIFGIYVV